MKPGDVSLTSSKSELRQAYIARLQQLDVNTRLNNDTKGIIDVCKGLSLNDSYWVVPEGFEGTFAQYNLYENRFSEMLALVAYTGAGQSRQAFTTSPELTTGGMLPKAWRVVEQDGIYLYKGGTTGASNAGREPYCEYYASQIAQTMRLNAVHYDLENWKGITASTHFPPMPGAMKIALTLCVKSHSSQEQNITPWDKRIRDTIGFRFIIRHRNAVWSRGSPE